MVKREAMYQNDNRVPESATLQDELFSQLSHPVRRQILRELSRAGPGTGFSIDDLAIDGTWSESDRVELHHNHLPRLTAVGYVEWDRETDTIARGPRFETVAPMIHLMVKF